MNDLELVIEKVRKLNTKAGPFECVLLLGTVDLQKHDINNDGLPPLVFINSSISSGENSTEVSNDNVTLLKRFGIWELGAKLRIGYITLNDKELMESKNDILQSFSSINQPLDILITRQWSVTIADRQNNTLGHEIVDELCRKLQPKYHFVYDDSEKFFELEPFLWENNQRITRFINLATFASGSKWAYAFNINIDSELENEQPRNLIGNPYVTTQNKKRSLEKRLANIGASEERDDSMVPAKKVKTILPTGCHFCFTNPNVEDHMFVSIGNRAYVTTAKGPLSVPKGDMTFSGHCLIVPIEHVPKLNMGQENFTENDLMQELLNYQRSIVKMNYRKFDMATVVFEIHSDKSIHFHKQIIPVPKFLIMRFKDALDRQLHFNNEKYTHNAKLDFKNFSSETDSDYLAIVNDPKSNYMQFTIYETSESGPDVYLSHFQRDDRIDLQFGRRVVAFLLHLPKRVNWNSPACKQSKEQEENEVKKFQKGYNEYDIANNTTQE